MQLANAMQFWGSKGNGQLMPASQAGTSHLSHHLSPPFQRSRKHHKFPKTPRLWKNFFTPPSSEIVILVLMKIFNALHGCLALLDAAFAAAGAFIFSEYFY